MLKDGLSEEGSEEMTECEHHFIITTERWEYQQREFTVRYCDRCGLTHRLVWYTRPSKWVLEYVPEETQEYYRAKEEEEE